MKIAITEYENGGWNHIAGTIAQADNLGIFGSQGFSQPTSGLLAVRMLTFSPGSGRSAALTA